MQTWDELRSFEVRPGTPRLLTFAQAEEVRQLYRSGRSQRRLARQFGISHTAIHAIVNRKTYRAEHSDRALHTMILSRTLTPLPSPYTKAELGAIGATGVLTASQVETHTALYLDRCRALDAISDTYDSAPLAAD